MENPVTYLSEYYFSSKTEAYQTSSCVCEYCDDYKCYYDNDIEDTGDIQQRTSFATIIDTFQPVMIALGSVAKDGEALGMSYFPDWANKSGMLDQVMNKHDYTCQEAYTVYRSTMNKHIYTIQEVDRSVGNTHPNKILIKNVRTQEHNYILINPDTAKQYRDLLKIEPRFYTTDEYVILLIKDQIALHVVLDDDYKYQVVGKVQFQR